MLGLVGFVVGLVVVAALAVGGRWAAGLVFGARRLKDALAPWGDEGASSPALAISRALGGVSGWYLGAALVFAFAMTWQGRVSYDEASMRVRVAAGGPADVAGIRDGDRVVAIDDEPIGDWDRLRRAVAMRDEGDRMRVTIDHEGSRREVVVRPVKIHGVTKMLVGAPVEKTKIGFGSAFAAGSKQPLDVVKAAVRGVGRILVGAEHAEAIGPAGIVREASAERPDPFPTSMSFAAALASYVWPLVILMSAVFALVAARRRSHLKVIAANP